MTPEQLGDRDSIAGAVEAIMTGRMSRQEFVKRATVLGIAAGSIASVLAACAGDDEAAAPSSEKPFAGTTINALIVAEGEQQGVQDKIGEIKDRFGIDLKMTALGAGPLVEQANQAVNAAESPFDVIQVLGFSVTQLVGGGSFERLNPFLEDPAKTPSDYDFPEDFPPAQLEYVGQFDIDNQDFGGDDVYLIPGLHGGSVIMFYRRDLLEAAGLQPPTTWEEYLAAAAALNQDGVAGTSMIAKSGDASLFLVDWYTRFVTMGGVLMSGSPAEKNFRPNLTGPEAVAALQHMVDCMEVSSQGVLQYDFIASVDAFSAGNTALMLQWSSIAAPMFDSSSSKVADKVGAAANPGIGGNAGKAIRGGWGIGIPQNAKNKDAAWQVITFLTSKEFEQYQVGTYGTDPSRISTFTDPELVEQLPYLPVAFEVYEKAEMLDLAHVPEAFELITIAAEEFPAALNRSKSAAEALQSANNKWTDVLKRGGHLA